MGCNDDCYGLVQRLVICLSDVMEIWLKSCTILHSNLKERWEM